MAGLNGAEEQVDDGLMNLDFNRICRLCLNYCRDYVDLRPSNGTHNAPRHIIDQIKYCYSIKIDLTEPLPSKICLQCIQILTLLSATKRNIKYSEMMLKNILSIRNAHRMINAQNRQRLNHTLLQRLSRDNHERDQELPLAEGRPTQDNTPHTQGSPLQNLKINPIQITTMQELYKIQDQALQKNNQNSPRKSNLNQSTEEHRRNRNIENTRRKSGNAVKAAENKAAEMKSNLLKSVEIKQDVSNNTNNSVKASSSKPSTSSNSRPADKNVSKTTKAVEEDKMKNTNKKTNVVNNINKKKYEIDMRRELKVKLEILDLKNTKFYCPPSTDGPSRSTEGQGGGTSGESKSGKVVKEIGTVIDESNILSPKVKRMRKSIPKG